jgi:hypothetical protein
MSSRSLSNDWCAQVYESVIPGADKSEYVRSTSRSAKPAFFIESITQH